MQAFPEFIPPMLAALSAPFDSEEHLFEIKWDGYRALLRRGSEGLQLWSRNRNDLLNGFAEFRELDGLPPGTLLDGEIVIFTDEKPDFQALQRRARTKKESGMAVYLVFDLLYSNYEARTGRPLLDRRAELRELVAALDNPRMQFSDGVLGGGREYFEGAAAQGLEGVIAKRLDSLYESGRRTGAWKKIKRRESLHCAVVGYLENESGAVKSLSVASDTGQGLRYIGQVGSGFSLDELAQLKQVLSQRVRSKPLIPLPPDVRPVEPGVYCLVSYVELTRERHLRAPVCESWSVEQ